MATRRALALYYKYKLQFRRVHAEYLYSTQVSSTIARYILRTSNLDTFADELE